MNLENVWSKNVWSENVWSENVQIGKCLVGKCLKYTQIFLHLKSENVWSENVRIRNCLNRKLSESENVESENGARKMALGNCRIGKRTRASTDDFT